MGGGFLAKSRLRRPACCSFLVKPGLRCPAGCNFLLYPFAHLLVGREVFPTLRVVNPQSAAFILPHLEPERFAAQAEPAVDQGDAR